MQRPHESFFKRLFVRDQCVILSKNMADKNAIEKMISQDDLPIIVIPWDYLCKIGDGYVRAKREPFFSLSSLSKGR